VWLVGAAALGMVRILSSARRAWLSAVVAPLGLDSFQRMCWAAQCYGEVGSCGERSTSRVISLGAKTRNGGPQKPVPRLV
jgi:hypothetical protein